MTNRRHWYQPPWFIVAAIVGIEVLTIAVLLAARAWL